MARRKKSGLRYEQRQEEARDRQKIRDRRTPKEQIDVLDQRLGKDVGAARERLRLLTAIEEAYKKDEQRKSKKKEGSTN